MTTDDATSETAVYHDLSGTDERTRDKQVLLFIMPVDKPTNRQSGFVRGWYKNRGGFVRCT